MEFGKYFDRAKKTLQNAFTFVDPDSGIREVVHVRMILAAQEAKTLHLSNEDTREFLKKTGEELYEIVQVRDSATRKLLSSR